MSLYVHKDNEKPSPATTTAPSPSPTESPSATAAVAARSTSTRKRRTSISSSRGVANLTPDQLAKKRANDREAQRAIRERTKIQIETLERRIRELTSQQPYQDLQHVIRQKEAVEAENEEIKRRLTTVLNLIQPLVSGHALGDLNTPPYRDAPTSRSIPSPRTDSSSHHDHYTPISVSYPETATVQSHSAVSTIHTPPFQPPWPISAAPTPGVVPPNAGTFVPDQPFERLGGIVKQESPHQMPIDRGGLGYVMRNRQEVQNARHAPDLGRPGPPLPADSHITLAASHHQGPNQAYRASNSSSGQLPAYTTPIINSASTCPLDTLLLDFLSERRQRAAEGMPQHDLVGPAYPNVSALIHPERSELSHPLSRVFTDILSKFPDLSALPEQVGTLYIMFLIMRWQVAPTQENYARLPDWVKPSPSQLLTAHPVWIDHLPWPRLRDKMIQGFQQYQFENWFIPFTTTLSLNWPHDPRATLWVNEGREELSIHPEFERHLRDLGNWSLGPAFAAAFPTLASTVRIKPDSDIGTR